MKREQRSTFSRQSLQLLLRLPKLFLRLRNLLLRRPVLLEVVELGLSMVDLRLSHFLAMVGRWSMKKGQRRSGEAVEERKRTVTKSTSFLLHLLGLLHSSLSLFDAFFGLANEVVRSSSMLEVTERSSSFRKLKTSGVKTMDGGDMTCVRRKSGSVAVRELKKNGKEEETHGLTQPSASPPW